MISASVANLPNLLQNGGFEFVDPAAAASDLPAGWTAISGSHSVQVVRQSTPSEANEPRTYLEVTFGAAGAYTLLQSLLQDATYDFAQPTEPDTNPFLLEGFHGEERVTVRNAAVTLGFGIVAVSGRFRVSLYTLSQTNLADNVVATVDIKPGYDNRSWARLAAAYTSTTGVLKAIGVQVTPLTPGGVCRIGNLSLAAGAYSAIPYLGNPTLQMFPKGSLVFVTGAACPVGFKELDLGGKYLAAAETPGATGGSATHSHEGTETPLPAETHRMLGPEDASSFGPLTLGPLDSVLSPPGMALPGQTPSGSLDAAVKNWRVPLPWRGYTHSDPTNESWATAVPTDPADATLIPPPAVWTAAGERKASLYVGLAKKGELRTLVNGGSTVALDRLEEHTHGLQAVSNDVPSRRVRVCERL